MTDSPSILLAFAAGLVSFVSPCTLPLVPGYMAVIAHHEEGDERPRRHVLVARSLVFVATFSLIFILLGLSATALGAFLVESQLTLRRVAGAVIVGMGILFIASVFVLRLNRDWRPATLLSRAGRGGPVLAGAAFALAWTPCVGPTLGAILGLAASRESITSGAALLAVYSVGLALPFLACAAGLGSAERSFRAVSRHFGKLQVGAGLVLIAMGVLVYTNELFRVNIEMQQALDGAGLNFFQYF